MAQSPTYADKNIGNMINSFRNKQHRETTEEYLFIRKRIDKVKGHTLRNDVQSLLALDFYLQDKPYKEATQDDMLHFEAYLENEYQSNRRPRAKKPKGLSKSTIEQYEAHIKRFYKYLSNPTEYKKGKRFQKNISYPNNVSWISSSTNNHNKLPLDNLLTEKQVLELLNACTLPRDQALFGAALYDAGLRLSEAISLNIRSVGFDELGGYFILPKNIEEGLKTGMRKIRLFLMPSSTKYLKEFMNRHPFKKYDDAPLFYSLDGRKYYNVLKKSQNKTTTKEDWERIRLSPSGIEGTLRNMVTLIGLPPITPHVLRHNSCTLAAKAGFNEMELRIRYGWSSTSKMPSRYTHLASKDLDAKIKIITGYTEPVEKAPSELVTIQCWNCDEENVPTNKFCSRCGSKLNPEKEELAPSAKDIGLAMQKGMSKTQLEDMMKETLQKMMQDDDETLKKYLKKK